MIGNKKIKVMIIIVAFIVTFGLIVSIPSLAKLKNRNTIYSVSSWDGTVATSYKKGDGTLENPFIISNGAEFAFFIEELKKTDNKGYEEKYFELSNDIIINSGVFEYSNEEGLKYIVDDKTYYVNKTTGEYYSGSLMDDEPVGKINTTSMIENFKGNFNGKSFTIFGLHITNDTEEDVALFKNLDGTITDLYITNTVVEGTGDVSGLAVNSIGSTITNLVYDGFVINNSSSKLNETEIEPISITATTLGSTETLILPQISIEGMIKSIKLVGEYQVNDQTLINSLTINSTPVTQSTFEVDLTANTLTEIPVSVVSTIDDVVVNLSNMKYQIEYYDNITSGIIANSTNVVLNNVINKADIYGSYEDVYGNYISTGMVGKVNESLQITQSYNTGTIIGKNISSGIIGLISENSNDITITNVYNTGVINSNISAAIIGVANNNTGIININNVVNAVDNYAINTITNSTINIANSYSTTGLTVYNCDNLLSEDNVFKQENIESFYTSSFMSIISYNEFVDFTNVETNKSNAWIYEKNSLPILYIDDLNNPIANLNVNKYSWNNLSDQLNEIEIPTNITFSIENVSAVMPIKEKYYYVYESREPLAEDQLNSLEQWEKYDDVVTIENSGYYIIYAKIIDTDGNITYINTDVLVLNVSGFQTKIIMDDTIWETFESNLNEIYLSKDINLTIYAHDDLISINSVEYYISDKELTLEDLNKISEWTTYTNYITINTLGKYVIYAKIVNSEGTIKYVNTDYLLYGGYTQSISLGNNNKNYETNYITNKSSIKLTFESNFEITYNEGDSHNFISNMLLPLGTKLTLIDNSTNKVYRKVIETEEDLYGYNSSCEGNLSCSKYATYPFSIFEEIGTTNLIYYPEASNVGKTISSEKYVIVVDFSNTNLVDNYYDISFSLAIKSSSGKYLYQTLDNTMNNINIYSTTGESDIITEHSLKDDYSNQTIYYNSNSETDINLTNVVTYSVINDKNVIDTTYENKKSGVIIGLYDENGIQINKEYLDNMIFEIGEKEYFAGSDNTIKINLGSVVNSDVMTLKIKTKENSSTLANGNYYIKINKFLSNDGYFYETLYEDAAIVIPLVVENATVIIPDYNFDVEMTSESLSFSKELETHLATFSITYSGTFVEPNIRVSLHQKDELTAYNQKYTLINLSDYVSDNLVSADTNKYYVDILNPTLNINLISNKFSNNGYKYVFELYDGTRKISEITKYFIVR